MALLKKLVADAHKHDIKILLDYVSHHVFKENPIYKNHRDWFGNLYLPDGSMNLRMWDDHRLTTWFEPYLPTFDYIHSEKAREFMTDNAVWLLKETGADGFRHDAVKHVPNVFWRTLTKKLKRNIEIPNKRNIYQIGETFGSYNLVDSYVNNGQLNAQFDFNLYDTAIPTFIDKNGSFVNLAAALHKSFAVYGVNNLMGNIMDSHDKVRFMAYADGDVPLNGGNAAEIGWDNPPHVDHRSSYKKLELYMAYMLTIPGVPVIDYGDEIGMTGAADPDNRRMMRFGNDLDKWERETLQIVREILKTRNRNSALRYGDFQTIQDSKDTFVYLRSDMNERVLVCLNKSDSPGNFNISLPHYYNIKLAEDAVSGKRMELKENMIKFTVPGTGFRILKLR
jgi:glycosidase